MNLCCLSKTGEATLRRLSSGGGGGGGGILVDKIFNNKTTIQYGIPVYICLLLALPDTFSASNTVILLFFQRNLLLDLSVRQIGLLSAW